MNAIVATAESREIKHFFIFVKVGFDLAKINKTFYITLKIV